ncbi:MAG: serine/threonine protein kinase [Pirellulaceae bacterium]
MISTAKCPQCDNQIQSDAPGGLCPACLMNVAISGYGSNQETIPVPGVFNAPAPEELSHFIEALEVEELLGHGGMGAVYRARQINLDRPVALKILAPRLSNDPSFAERFTREARTLARLNHPNIVTVFDFGHAGDYYYLIMELIDGVNLRDAILSGGLRPEQALAIVPKICEALQYAHDQGVVHRDIKPENILVGQRDQIKIADFGLAKMLGTKQSSFTLTGTQQVLGTRNYMAPEQIEKPSTVDHRADIYSLGVVFYELLTGELPLGRFSLPSEKARVTGQMDDVIMRTLEKEPNRRFQQASEVKTAVESIDMSIESPLEPINGIESSEPLPVKPPVVEAAAAAAAMGEGPPASHRRLSLPFHNDQVHGGFSQLHGIAHLNEKALEIEFRTHKLGVAKGAKRTVKIPYGSVVSSLLTRGMFSNTLEIQAASLETFDEIPSCVQGRLQMVLDKKHDQLVEEFHLRLDYLISQASPQARADQNAASAESLAHVPFNIDGIHTGMTEASGIAKVTNDHLIIEYQNKDVFGIVKSAPRAVAIPLSELVSLTFRHGWWYDKIHVQTASLDNVANIPDSEHGKFRLITKKSDRHLARNWARQAQRLAGLPMSENLVESKPDSVDQRSRKLKRQLLIPRILLLLMAAINIIGLGMVAWLTIFGMLDSSLINGTPSTLVEVARGIAIIDSAFMVLVSVALFRWLGQLRNYHLVLACLFLTMLPVHMGIIVGLPLAIWLVTILWRPENRELFNS